MTSWFCSVSVVWSVCLIFLLLSIFRVTACGTMHVLPVKMLACTGPSNCSIVISCSNFFFPSRLHCRKCELGFANVFHVGSASVYLLGLQTSPAKLNVIWLITDMSFLRPMKIFRGILRTSSGYKRRPKGYARDVSCSFYAHPGDSRMSFQDTAGISAGFQCCHCGALSDASKQRFAGICFRWGWFSFKESVYALEMHRHCRWRHHAPTTTRRCAQRRSLKAVAVLIGDCTISNGSPKNTSHALPASFRHSTPLSSSYSKTSSVRIKPAAYQSFRRKQGIVAWTCFYFFKHNFILISCLSSPCGPSRFQPRAVDAAC